MYWVKQRAVAPSVTGVSATLHEGMAMLVRPALFAAAATPVGVISLVPTIASGLSEELTVFFRGRRARSRRCRDDPYCCGYQAAELEDLRCRFPLVPRST